MNVAARLYQLCATAGHAIVSVSIARREDKTTWTVQPSELQAVCQPIIDAFDPADPAHEAAEQDAAARRDVNQRVTAAVIWVLLRRLVPADTAAQTKAKHVTFRDDVIAAFKSEPWK